MANYSGGTTRQQQTVQIWLTTVEEQQGNNKLQIWLTTVEEQQGNNKLCKYG